MIEDVKAKYDELEAKVDAKLASLVAHQWTAAFVVIVALVALVVFGGAASV